MLLEKLASDLDMMTATSITQQFNNDTGHAYWTHPLTLQITSPLT